MDSIAIDREEGPSWARANWPLASLDAVNQGLDPTEATIEQVAAAASKAATATGADPEAVRKAADDSIRAMMLIRSFRVRGHLAAKLDPLGLAHFTEVPELQPAYHGFTEADLDRKIWLGGTLGFQSPACARSCPCSRPIIAARSASNICTSTT
jgi:2-oxoglutarate dehydrogenase E1 component